MKTRRRGLYALLTLTIAGLVAGSLAYASARVARDQYVAKRITRALTKAGVDQTRIDGVLAQLNELRPELKSMFREHGQAVEAIAELSADQKAEVDARVQDLLRAHQKGREKLAGMIETVGQSLSPREKASLVLGFAERASHRDVECGSRIDDVTERLEDHELVSATEAAAIREGFEQARPELCGLRSELKAQVESLKKAVADSKTTDAELEAIFAKMKANRHAAAQARIETIGGLLPQLSPGSQIQLAQKLSRLHHVAELVLSL